MANLAAVWSSWLRLALIASLLSSLVIAAPCEKKFELTLTWEKWAPDGVERNMVLINGKFPGPTLEMNEGDNVEVLVHNKMPFNTSVHFHGIFMRETPWSDGVPGVTQRQIKSGETFNYKWHAAQYGSYWYHGHQQGQVEDGMYGAIVIHPSKDKGKPWSRISQDDKVIAAIEKAAGHSYPLLLADHRHRTADEIVHFSREANMELPCFDSILFNGKGSVNCIPPETLLSLLSPQQRNILRANNVTNFTPKGCLPPHLIARTVAPTFPVNAAALPPDVVDTCTPTSGGPKEVITAHKETGDEEKWISIDLIGAFHMITGIFSIDEHPLWVYAVDGEFIQPQLVHAIPITNGDRYSILVRLNAAGEYPIRLASASNSQVLFSSAVLSYSVKDEPAPVRPTTPYVRDNGQPASNSTVFYSTLKQKQLVPDAIAQNADQTYKLMMRTAGTSFQWALNSSAFNAAILDSAAEAVLLFSPQFHDQDNVTITTNNDTWVDIVLITATLPMPPHPIHKHGNKMYQIGAGIGPFPWATVAEAVAAVPQAFNLVDPPKRDGFLTAQASPTNATWTVLRYHVTQPGAWLLHCHVQSHFQGGMSMVIQDGADHWPVVPDEYRNF